MWHECRWLSAEGMCLNYLSAVTYAACCRWDPAVHREALAACRELCRKCTAPEPIIICLRLLEYANTDSEVCDVARPPPHAMSPQHGTLLATVALIHEICRTLSAPGSFADDKEGRLDADHAIGAPVSVLTCSTCCPGQCIARPTYSQRRGTLNTSRALLDHTGQAHVSWDPHLM